ncbi:heterokaryon incompatibility protein-domain-containing protein [Hypoxylon trugodes]|uniref:heterokaryon incompatibility protein-domain-containing protein n=1 Tax=Hypoxylon trugodes TaxID=326681 RepID=UPI00219C1674|nr:heterokaryon incompatibility protein-domain-containing protein [Hypoxylon trugodes]KAI1383847.1 heterokaryon incompatibility protein-domain-containing protein [Hypoxylon trugodes]
MDTWNAQIAPLLYQTLSGENPIRLLHLYPDKPGEPLYAELVSTTIEKASGAYEATSYTWGSPANPCALHCNNFNIQIQRNAFDMLQDLRFLDKPRIVWIDAICINQSDIEERALQVSFMHDIYQQARKVLIWLGNPDEYSAMAMAYAEGLDISKLAGEIREMSTPGWGIEEKSYFFEPNEGTESNQHRTLGVALVRFINRPWFTRVWVQQEASLCAQTQMILPKNIGLYPDYISDDLNRMLNSILAIQHIQRRRKRLLQDLNGGSNKSHWSLATFLNYTNRLGATDPRDKLYALQYIAQDASTWFQVDYKIPWQILYADVSRKFLQNGILQFIRSAGKPRRESRDSLVPSWALDLTNDTHWGSETIVEHPSWMAGGPKFTFACGDLRAAGSVQNLPRRHRRWLDLPDELKNFNDPRKALLQSYANIKCLICDEIIYVADPLDDPFDVEGMLEIFGKDLDHIAELTAQTYINGDNHMDAYKLTLILSYNDTQEIVHSEYIHNNWEPWIAWLKDPTRTRDNMPILEYSIEASGAPVSFRFAMTKHGYFCLVPRETRLNDVVSIFVSYSLGVVIRPWQPPSHRKKRGQHFEESLEQTEYFELIGDCFINGMMRNEARCLIEEFHCKPNPTDAKLDAMIQASKIRNGESWKTLGLNSGYARLLGTLGERLVKLV